MTALEEIKKALEGVTPGPWELCAHLKYNDACSCGYRGVIYGPEPDGFAICQPGHEPAPEGQEGTEPPRYPRDVEIANMRYIAAVNPAAISELLSTLESSQRENERLGADVKREAELATHMANDCNDAQARAEAAEAEVKRLQTEIDRKSSMPGDHRYWEGRYRDEAAENEKLREALMPFGREGEKWHEMWPDDHIPAIHPKGNVCGSCGAEPDCDVARFTVGDLRTARQALASTGGEHNADK